MNILAVTPFLPQPGWGAATRIITCCNIGPPSYCIAVGASGG